MVVFALVAALIALGLFLPWTIRAHEKQKAKSHHWKAVAQARLDHKFGGNAYVLLWIEFKWGINKSEGLVISLETLLKDSNDEFWRTKQAIRDKDRNIDETFTPLTESGIRRALFNKPKEYLATFGESPDRKQLAQLMGEVNE